MVGIALADAWTASSAQTKNDENIVGGGGVASASTGDRRPYRLLPVAVSDRLSPILSGLAKLTGDETGTGTDESLTVVPPHKMSLLVGKAVQGLVVAVALAALATGYKGFYPDQRVSMSMSKLGVCL